MATVSGSSPPALHLHKNHFSFSFSSRIVQFPSCGSRAVPNSALKTASDGGKVMSQELYGQDVLRKPAISSVDGKEEESEKEGEEEDEEEEVVGAQWVDWEEKILEETVPLAGLVRMILHSGKYKSWERLSDEHEKTIVERLLPYHPSYETKIGCGIDYLTVGYHPEFEGTRCLFIVRKDGEMVDFSYWKCIKGLIRKKYPLFADSFILRHFRRRRLNR